VDVQHGLELLVGGLLDDRVPGVACVVDDDVDRAEGAERRSDDGGGRGGIGDVAGNRADARGRVELGFELGCGGRESVFVEVVEHDAGAGREQALGDGATDSAGGAGDEGGAAFEGKGHWESLLYLRHGL
jgi:hypothetical protein